MKTIGIDIGTTTISGVVMENKTAEKSRTLEAKQSRMEALSQLQMNGKKYRMQNRS